MHTFSELLSFLVHQKDIDVYSMTLYCGIERTAMYRYLNGKDCPDSQNTVKHMADFMRLTPPESEQLLRAWKVQNTDPRTWAGRQSVRNFLLNFPDILSSGAPSGAPLKRSEKKVRTSYPGCRALPTSVALNHSVRQMILDEFQRSDGRLRLMLQPDYDYLFQFLTSSRESCPTDHILCLGASSSLENGENSHLLYLQKLLPLYLGAGDYHIFYYYDMVESHFLNLNAFPCLILTSTCAVTCTSDFQSGILYGNPEIVQMLTEYFETCRSHCSPLLYPASSVEEICGLITSLSSGDSPYYTLQPEPCITPFLTPDFLERILSQNMENRDSVLKLLKDFLAGLQNDLARKDFFCYHTYAGIRRFLDTGKLCEFPDSLYEPLSYDDRLLLLYRLFQNTPEHCRLLRGPLEKLPLNFHLCVSAAGGYLMFTNKAHEMVYLRFQEPGLVSAFTDYLRNLEEDSLYTADQSLHMIQSLLESPNPD